MSLDNKKHFNSGVCSSTNICRELDQKINARYSESISLTINQPMVVLFKSNVPLPVTVRFSPGCDVEVIFTSECGDIVEVLNTFRSIVLSSFNTTEITVRCLNCTASLCSVNYDLTIGSNLS